MRHIAIIGSGPSGFYAAEAALKAFGPEVRIDILDRLPTPYGLIRAGVAPDHQSIKAVSRRYEAVAKDPRVTFIGSVEVGRDIPLSEVRSVYDDVVLAVGAPEDRKLGISGEELPGVFGSGAFVGWYNGHPDFAKLSPPLDTPTIVVIGNGNVAIDCARVLAKTAAELASSDIAAHALSALANSALTDVHILGRRGPYQASFTLKEIGELGELERATPIVQPSDLPDAEGDAALETGQRRVVEVLRRFAAAGPDPAKPVKIHFDFFHRPVRILGTNRVEGIEVARTQVDAAGNPTDTGEQRILSCGLVIAAVGYRSSPLEGAPFDTRGGRFANDAGRIDDGLWCVGWAKRGPSGTIGTNRPDGFAVIDRIKTEGLPASGKAGRAGLLAMLKQRGIKPTTFADWEAIDRAEVAAARPGAPREKIVEMAKLRALCSA
ncbi:FAD-dependent oxidoreductase [Thermaurantiacus sp.]